MRKAFIQLGKDMTPTVELTGKLEEFVCQVYDLGISLKSVAEVRWKLFCRNQAEGQKLPPTVGALQYIIHRAHYLAMLWEADNVAKADLPHLTNYGWKVEGNGFAPVSTPEPPAPLAIVELIRCQCSKSQCERRCPCKQHKLFCTEMCKCESSGDMCKNTTENCLPNDNSEGSNMFDEL